MAKALSCFTQLYPVSHSLSLFRTTFFNVWDGDTRQRVQIWKQLRNILIGHLLSTQVDEESLAIVLILYCCTLILT